MFEKLRGGTPIRADRALAGALDAAIRSSRQNNAPAPETCSRLLSLWRQAGVAELSVTALTLGVGAEPLLTRDREAGRWLLPAFMAGVRALRLLDETREDDLGRLCVALGALRPTHDAIVSFQDWLWSGGAEGIGVELQLSFVEVFELLDSGPALDRNAFRLVRGAALVPLGHIDVAMSSSELDMAALRPEFDVELTRYVRAVAGRGFEQDPVELTALRSRCEDEQRWCRDELRAALATPALQRGLPPRSLASRLMTLLAAGRLEPQTLLALEALAAAQTPWARAVVAALEAASVGATIGRQASRQLDPLAAPLIRWMQAWGPASAQACMGALLQSRAALDPLAGWPDARDAIPWAQLDARGARRALELAAALGADPAALWTLSDRLTGGAAEEGMVWLVGRGEGLDAARPLLAAYMQRASSGALQRLIPLLLDKHGDLGISICIAQLDASHGTNWSQLIAQHVFSYWDLVPDNRARCVALVQDRHAPLWLRKRALTHLSEEDAGEALKLRVGELLEEQSAASWIRTERSNRRKRLQ